MKGEKDTRARVEKRAGGTGKRKGREWVTKTNDTQSPLCKPTTCKTITKYNYKKQEEFEHISEDTS